MSFPALPNEEARRASKNAANRRYKARRRGEVVDYVTRPWTGKETLELARLYEKGLLNRDGHLQKLATKLGRTFSAVASQACVLGLSGPRTASRKQPDSTSMALSLARERERIAGIPGTHLLGKGGRRDDLGGRYFRSAWEANYARFLNWSKIAWEYETKTFRFDGIARGTMSYTPDFFIPSTGEYHEVKGWMDQRSKTQLARMSKYFPEVKIVLIRKDWFKVAHRQGLSGVIPGWERWQ